MSERVPAGGVFRAASMMHESLNLEHLNEAKSLLYTYCPGPFCREFLDRLAEASKLVAKARLSDLSFDENYMGIDGGLFKAVRRILEVYSDYISGIAVTFGEDMAVRVISPFALDNTVVEPGEIVPVPLDKGVGLILAGLAEPVRETAIKLPG